MAELLDAPWIKQPKQPEASDLPDAPWAENTSPKDRTWGGAALEGIGNIPESAVKFGSDIAQPFLHPINTATAMKDLGIGVLEKTGLLSGQDHSKYADAVGKMLVDRYGSVEAVKKTLATDPVGLAGDLSMLFTGGGTAAARTPGLVGKIGEAANIAGRAIDPVNAAIGAGKLAGKAGAEVVGGMGTGTGAQSIETAARAGYEGGKAGEEFQKNLRGQGPMREVVDDARKAVGQMRQERGAEYRAAMTKVGADKTILSWNDVDTALADMDKVATFKGQSLSPSTAAIRDSIKEEVEAWKNLQASEFGTAEGFDALKRRVGDIRDSTQYGTPERHVADQAYNAIRSTIVKQVPAYGKIMQGYEEASDIIREMEKTLSLNPTATIDTALRKLQSVLRNNVNTSYGRRAELMDFLTRAGAPHLMEKLSGQALNTWTPRGGFGKLLMGGAAGSALAHPAAAAAIPLMSPRAVGEGAYYAGKAASKLPARQIRRAVEPARQVGRATDYLDNPGDSSDALDNARP